MTSLRIGLAGLGIHGQRYAHHLVRDDIDGVSLAAFWRRRADEGRRAATRLGARFEPDLDALIESPDVDALIGVVPAGFHEQLALRAAAAKKPLLLEKPIARSVAEAERMCRAFEEAATPFMIAQTLRFDPLTELLARRAESMGPIVGFAFEQRLEPRDVEWEDSADLAGGGVLIQTAIHALDALRVVTAADRIDVVGCHTNRIIYRQNEDHGIVTLRASGGHAGHGSGALGDVHATKIGQFRRHRYALFFGGAAVEADYVGRTLTELTGRDRQVQTVGERPTIVDCLAAFARSVRTDAPVPIPGEEGLASLGLVESAYAVARAGGAPAPDR